MEEIDEFVQEEEGEDFTGAVRELPAQASGSFALDGDEEDEPVGGAVSDQATGTDADFRDLLQVVTDSDDETDEEDDDGFSSDEEGVDMDDYADEDYGDDLPELQNDGCGNEDVTVPDVHADHVDQRCSIVLAGANGPSRCSNIACRHSVQLLRHARFEVPNDVAVDAAREGALQRMAVCQAHYMDSERISAICKRRKRVIC